MMIRFPIRFREAENIDCDACQQKQDDVRKPHAYEKKKKSRQYVKTEDDVDFRRREIQRNT